MSSFDYEIVKCRHCGTANATFEGRCRRCGRPLKKSGGVGYVGLLVGGLTLFAILIGVYIFFAQGTVLGDITVIALIGLSSLLSIVGTIWLWVEAFRAGPIWGLAVIFVPFAQLVFLIAHTDRALKPFMLSLVALLMLAVAFFLIVPAGSVPGF